MEDQMIDYKLEQSYKYEDYRTLIADLLADNKTTGENQSDNYIHYTKMNQQRMKRLDKTVHLTEETKSRLAEISNKQVWLVLTEAWCGDAAQNIPVIQKMAEANDNIDLRLHLRDSHLDIMDAFLTNNARSIPKLIIIDTESEEVLGTWGPRPQELQAMVLENKRTQKLPGSEFTIVTQQWYNDDKGVSVQKEILDLL